jgi:hypothetical protein
VSYPVGGGEGVSYPVGGGGGGGELPCRGSGKLDC